MNSSMCEYHAVYVWLCSIQSEGGFSIQLEVNLFNYVCAIHDSQGCIVCLTD